MPEHFLPDDKADLEVAMKQAVLLAKRARRIPQIEWFIVRHYLMGCRHFDSVEYDTGTVRPSYQNVVGDLPFKFEELVNKYSTEVGRLLRLDVAPAVLRAATRLDGLRKESAAQAILDAVEARLSGEKRKREFLEMFVQYGAVGLLALQSNTQAKVPADKVQTEVVPPWEILMFPGNARSPSETYAKGRHRWVPWEWLKKQKIAGQELKLPADTSDVDLRIRWVPAGHDLIKSELGDSTTSARGSRETFDTGRNVNKQPKRDRTPEDVAHVELCEIWIPRDNDRLERQIVLAGDVVVLDMKYDDSDKAPMMPLGFAVRGEGIGLYGRSYIATMVPLSAEIEAAFVAFIQNIQDIDLFGTLAIPTSMNVDESDLAEGLHGRRYFNYEPDPTLPNQRIEHFQPVTSGQLPQAALGLGLSMLDRAAQQPEIVTQGEAPGRVDSTPALDFLYKASTVPLSTMASSIADAYGTVYKSILSFASKWKAVDVNMETMLDDSIVGIKLEPGSGQITLDTNNVPGPLDVKIGIRSQKPSDNDKTKADLDLMLQQGLISQMQYRITARMKKLEIPLPEDAEWQNYRTAVLRNILVFNDGETPGDLGPGLSPSEFDNPEVHLMVLHRFMASPEFSLASTPVQDKFRTMVEIYRGNRGDLPDQFPHAEELPDTVGPPDELGGQFPGGGANPLGDLSSLGQLVGGSGAPGTFQPPQ